MTFFFFFFLILLYFVSNFRLDELPTLRATLPRQFSHYFPDPNDAKLSTGRNVSIATDPLLRIYLRIQHISDPVCNRCHYSHPN